MDIRKILLNPAGAFSDPEEVLASKDLKDQEKLKILETWANDLKLQDTAAFENMPGEDSNTLLHSKIHRCIAQLKLKIPS